MKYNLYEQGSQEWFQSRRGVPSASNFDRIMTPKTRKPSAQADEYIAELCGDVLSPVYPEGVEYFTSRAVQWGQQTEAEARKWLAIERDYEIWQVGFCMTDDARFGCSPDGLVGEEGVIELKCPMAKTHCSYVLKGVLPDEYLPQIHGALIVTGRPWLDFMSYHPGMEPLLIRVTPNDYTEALRKCLDDFYPKYQAALKRLKGEREPGVEPEEAA